MLAAVSKAWSRIGELADAIIGEYQKPDGDAKQVGRWAKEIGWQCRIIEQFRMIEEMRDD